LATSKINSIFKRFKAGEEDDKNMTFIDHLEALRWHIVRCLLIWLIAAIVIFIFRDWIFDNVIFAPAHTSFISYSVLCKIGHSLYLGQSLCMPPVDIQLQGNTVSGPFMSALNISMVSGLIIAFPYLFFELWRFIKPALSAKELKYGRKSIFWVSLCFFLGASFGYFLLAPFTFNFLANFHLGSIGSYKYLPTLDDYISTLNTILLGCGVSFELPILAVVLAKIGIINGKFLKTYRKYALVIILVLAAILTPSPDWISQAIVALPLVLLYEISIILVKNIDKKKASEAASWE
jgi:sec-independent protein translocase protein TatC